MHSSSFFAFNEGDELSLTGSLQLPTSPLQYAVPSYEHLSLSPFVNGQPAAPTQPQLPARVHAAQSVDSDDAFRGNSRACNACCTAKTKCEPSSEPGLPCRRCKRLRRECIVDHAPRKRAKATKRERSEQPESLQLEISNAGRTQTHGSPLPDAPFSDTSSYASSNDSDHVIGLTRDDHVACTSLFTAVLVDLFGKFLQHSTLLSSPKQPPSQETYNRMLASVASACAYDVEATHRLKSMMVNKYFQNRDEQLKQQLMATEFRNDYSSSPSHSFADLALLPRVPTVVQCTVTPVAKLDVTSAGAWDLEYMPLLSALAKAGHHSIESPDHLACSTSTPIVYHQSVTVNQCFEQTFGYTQAEIRDLHTSAASLGWTTEHLAVEHQHYKQLRQKARQYQSLLQLEKVDWQQLAAAQQRSSQRWRDVTLGHYAAHIERRRHADGNLEFNYRMTVCTKSGQELQCTVMHRMTVLDEVANGKRTMSVTTFTPLPS